MSSLVQTALTQIEAEHIRVRGFDLAQLIGAASFGDVVFLLFKGELPQGNEGRIIEAILVACIDHGVDAPSVHTARTVASCGTPAQAAIAAGVLAIGEHHGGAGEACARLLQESLSAGPNLSDQVIAERIVADARADGRRLPGFGHRQHPVDPRTQRLLAFASELGLGGRHIALAQAIEMVLNKTASRPLPMNVDGAIAAILSDLGLPWPFAKSIFILARTAGLAAHVYEQAATGKPLQFAAPVSAEYVGPAPRNQSDEHDFA